MIQTDARISTTNFISLTSAYLTEVLQPALSRARVHTPPTSYNFTIATTRIRILFYGQFLADSLAPAIMHLSCADRENPDLTIHVWNEDTDAGVVAPWSDQRFFSSPATDAHRPAHRFVGVCLQGDAIIEAFDGDATAYVRLPAAHDIPAWVTAAPARAVLHWFLAEKDIHLVHGAALGVDKHAILLTARGGSGKSTTAFVCAAAGLTFLGDDYVAIEDGSRMVHSVYNSVKVTEEVVRVAVNTKNISPLVPVPRDEHSARQKEIHCMTDLFPTQIRSSAALFAICIPTITTEVATRIEPATKIEALLALAPTTVMQLPFSQHDILKRLRGIIAQTQCFKLLLGSDQQHATTTMRNFISRSTP